MQTQSATKEEGFVLLEAIIAVGVLITIFAATIALYVSSVTGLRISNDQLIATYLGQDGMEQVIARHQYNYDNDLPYLDGLSHCTASNPCSAEYFEQSISSNLPACTDCTLYIDSGEYSSDSSGAPTRFKRMVEVVPNPNGHEAYVTVRVTWPDGENTLEMPVNYTLYANPNI